MGMGWFSLFMNNREQQVSTQLFSLVDFLV